MFPGYLRQGKRKADFAPDGERGVQMLIEVDGRAWSASFRIYTPSSVLTHPLTKPPFTQKIGLVRWRSLRHLPGEGFQLEEQSSEPF